MAKVSIPYGEGAVSFEVPDQNLVEVLNPNQVSFPEDETLMLQTAIVNPIGTGRLAEIVKPDSKVAIICDDISRPTPAYKIVPMLVEELNTAGIPDDQIFIVMALGSHRYMTEAEMDKKVGTAIRKRIKVYNSEFRQKAGMVDLGIAPGGVHVWADKRVMSADIRIGVGSIVPHPAVGWSGGGKIIYPGVTGEDTVAAFHLQHGRVPWNMFGSDKSPVRLSMEQWVDTVGLHFIVNVISSPDGRLYRAVAGHYVEAHRVGVEYAKELFGVKAQQKVEVVVASSHPADLDLWQAGKAITSSEFLVVDGGTLILVTPCPEDCGPHPEFTVHTGNDDIEDFMNSEEAQNGDVVSIAAAAAMARIRKRIRIAVVSEGISPKKLAEAKFVGFSSIDAALADCFAKYGAAAKVSVVPIGAETFPIVD